MEILLLFLLIIGGTIFAFIKLRSGEVLRFETTSAQRQVTMAVTGIVGAKRKWATLSQGDGSAQFVYAKKPNWLIVILLAITLIGFPIAVLYALLAGKKEALSINTESTGPDMTVVQIASNGWRGKGAGRALRSQLGLAPATVASILPTQEVGGLDPAAATQMIERADQAGLNAGAAGQAEAAEQRVERR